MFALPAGAWAGEPGSWAPFPAIRAPALIICGESEEPPAAGHARLAAQALPHGTPALICRGTESVCHSPRPRGAGSLTRVKRSLAPDLEPGSANDNRDQAVTGHRPPAIPGPTQANARRCSLARKRETSCSGPVRKPVRRCCDQCPR